MAFTALNGTETDSISASIFQVEYTVKNAAGMCLYIVYTKGTETNVEITYQLNDAKYPTEDIWFDVTSVATDGTITLKKATLTTTNLNTAVEIDIPKAPTNLRVVFTFTGNVSTIGDLSVFGVINTKYA